jgi:flavorubredoxin
MSANIVGTKQILLIASVYHEEVHSHYKLDLSSLWYIEQTANELKKHNIFSFTFGYGKATEHEPIKVIESWETVDTYRKWLEEFSTVEKIKLVQNYMYNSSEHPEWEFSQAKKICESCLSKLISQLDGWNEAPWGIV